MHIISHGVDHNEITPYSFLLLLSSCFKFMPHISYTHRINFFGIHNLAKATRDSFDDAVGMYRWNLPILQIINSASRYVRDHLLLVESFGEAT